MARARRQPAEDTNPVTPEKLERLVRSGITSHSEAAQELGVTVGQISSLAWSKALVAGGEYSEQPDTEASIRRMRDVEGLRWELVAARAGISVAEAKELHGDAENSVVSGRRSKADNGDAEEAEETTTRRGRGRASSAGKTTTGKRASAAATPRRSRTRAERRAGRSNNPS